MPLLYGEGQRAFTRLQHEIIRVHSDLTIFAWEAESQDLDSSYGRMIASSPRPFRRCSAFKRLGHPISDSRWESETTLSNAAIRITGPVLLLRDGTMALLLDCQDGNDFTKVLGLQLTNLADTTNAAGNTAEPPNTVRCAINFASSPLSRLSYYDALEAEDRTVVKTITFAAETAHRPWILPDVGYASSIWVRFANAAVGESWKIAATFPPQFWNPANLILDLLKARRNLYPSADDTMRACVKLCDKANVLGVGVAIIIDIPWSGNPSRFTVALCDKSKPIAETIEHQCRGTPQRTQSVDIGHGKALEVTAAVRDVFQQIVVTFTVDVRGP